MGNLVDLARARNTKPNQTKPAREKKRKEREGGREAVLVLGGCLWDSSGPGWG